MKTLFFIIASVLIGVPTEGQTAGLRAPEMNEENDSLTSDEWYLAMADIMGIVERNMRADALDLDAFVSHYELNNAIRILWKNANTDETSDLGSYEMTQFFDSGLDVLGLGPENAARRFSGLMDRYQHVIDPDFNGKLTYDEFKDTVLYTAVITARVVWQKSDINYDGVIEGKKEKKRLQEYFMNRIRHMTIINESSIGILKGYEKKNGGGLYFGDIASFLIMAWAGNYPVSSQ